MPILQLSVSSAMQVLEKNAVVNGVRMTYFERGISFRGKHPTLLFAHATGFHARIWDKIVASLGDYHSICIDQRGHGRSEKKVIQHWDDVIKDTVELTEQLDLKDAVGIGHSMGAHVLMGAAAEVPGRFARIVAIDPVIMSPEVYRNEEAHVFDGLDQHPTAKRRNEFDSPEEMAERLSGKGSYGLFDPDILMDYCRYGLLPNPKGRGYVLACPPEVEASVYMASRSNHFIHEAIRKLEIPVLILRAKEPDPDRDLMDFSSSPTWPGLVNELPQGRDIHFADKTHFLPMEIPEEITRLIKEEIDAEEDSRNEAAE